MTLVRAGTRVETVRPDRMTGIYLEQVEDNYRLSCSRRVEHTSIREDVTGYTDTYINGQYQGTYTHTTVNAYGSNATAGIKKVVTIKNEGEKVEVKLRKTL